MTPRLWARLLPCLSMLRSPISQQALRRPITLYIQLPGYTNFEGIDFNGVRVHHLKDAIIAKFKLDVAPQLLQLFKLHDDGSRTLLDPMQTLSEAGLRSDTKLSVVATITPGVIITNDAICRLCALLYTTLPLVSRRTKAGACCTFFTD